MVFVRMVFVSPPARAALRAQCRTQPQLLSVIEQLPSVSHNHAHSHQRALGPTRCPSPRRTLLIEGVYAVPDRPPQVRPQAR